MKITEFKSQIENKLKDAEPNDRWGVELQIKKAIEEVLAENNLEATVDYPNNRTEQCFSVFAKGCSKNNSWGFRVHYKLARKLVNSRYSYEHKIAKYQFKEIEVWDSCETVEEVLQEQIDAMNKHNKRAEDELQALTDYIDANPDFVKMYKIAKSRWYSLDDEHRKLFWQEEI